MLKIDTEGFDLEVLKGAAAMLKQRAISFEQNALYFNAGVLLLNLERWRSEMIANVKA